MNAKQLVGFPPGSGEAAMVKKTRYEHIREDKIMAIGSRIIDLR